MRMRTYHKAWLALKRTAMTSCTTGTREKFGIPAPTGKLPVGCVDLMHQFEGDDVGMLLVRLFYPAQVNPNQTVTYTNWTSHSKYLQAYLHFQKTWGPGLKAATLDNPTLNPTIPAVQGATICDSTLGAAAGCGSGSSNGFPVIIYSHGLGGMRCDNSTLCCDLASHGYVTAAVEHRYNYTQNLLKFISESKFNLVVVDDAFHRDRSACVSLQRTRCEGSSFKERWIEFYNHPYPGKEFQLRNKQVLQRSRDAILALELLTMLNEGTEVNNMMETDFDFTQFKGRLDMRKAAIMGHSFGGATTIQALSQDDRFQCGIALDCWMLPIHRDLLEAGVRQPLLFINSSDFQWPENVKAMFKLSHSSKQNNSGRSSIITLKGTGHGHQCDLVFLPLFSELAVIFASRLEPYTAYRVNADICRAFFRRHLLKDPAYQGRVPNLDRGEGESQHILFGSNIVSEHASKL